MKLKRLVTRVALISSTLPPSPVAACHTSCSGLDDCDSLNELLTLIKCKMPRAGSEAYTVPSDQTLEDWKQTVGAMLNGMCETTLPPSLEHYELGYFYDNSRTFCVLATFRDSDQDGIIDSPYGTVIVNQTPNMEIKDLSFDIPHPLFDSLTAEQGLAVFQGTNARSYVLAGAHRKANAAPSSCQNKFRIADAAHNTQNCFHASITAIQRYYDDNVDYTAVQFHGMAWTTCPNDAVYMTHGSGGVLPQSGEKIQLLRDAFWKISAQHGQSFSGRAISVPGETDCALSGGSNTAGRLLNGVPNKWACNSAAAGPSAKFIHIEQTYDIRQAHQAWIDAFNSIDFKTATPPRGFRIITSSQHNVGPGQHNVRIKWESTGMDPADDVMISLHLYNAAWTWVTQIAASTPNSGSYIWSIPPWIGPGENYVLRVRSIPIPNIVAFSEEPFTILRGPTYPWGAMSNVTPSITLQW